MVPRKRQNETMMCKSNNDIGLAGVDVGAEAGADNAYVIVRRVIAK